MPDGSKKAEGPNPGLHRMVSRRVSLTKAAIASHQASYGQPLSLRKWGKSLLIALAFIVVMHFLIG